MTDALIVLGIIDVLVVAAIVLFAKTDLAHRKLDGLHGSEDPHCTSCGTPTIYQAPLCPKCAQRLRESQGPRKTEGR